MRYRGLLLAFVLLSLCGGLSSARADKVGAVIGASVGTVVAGPVGFVVGALIGAATGNPWWFAAPGTACWVDNNWVRHCPRKVWVTK